MSQRARRFSQRLNRDRVFDWPVVVALLALSQGGCAVETLDARPVGLCVSSSLLVDVASEPTPHAVVWLWPTAEGFEVAGQAPVGPEHTEAPVCGTLQAPSAAAVLQPEDGLHIRLPWLERGHLGSWTAQERRIRAWSPAAVLYADLNRSGAFEPEADGVRLIQPMLGTSIRLITPQIYYVPTLPEIWRHPILAPLVRPYQPRPDAPFLEHDGLTLVEPDGQPYALWSEFDERCMAMHRSAACLFRWEHTWRFDDDARPALAIAASSVTALAQAPTWRAFQLTEAARRLEVYPDALGPAAGRGQGLDEGLQWCLREGSLHVAKVDTLVAHIDLDACVCEVESPTTVMLALDPPPPGWPCAPYGRSQDLDLRTELGHELGTTPAQLLLEAAAEVTAQHAAAATPAPTDPPAADP